MKYSPWGPIQDETVIAEGITSISTASHGGYKLDRKRNSQVPSYMRQPGGWYEEDCDYAIVVVVFKQFFSEEVLEHAKKSLMNWHPDEYCRFFGVPINSLAGKSYKYNQRLFEESHQNDWVVICAWGHGSSTAPYFIPSGWVGVIATVGGKRGREVEEKHFLVPAQEYANRSNFGFVIDLERHLDWGA